MPYSIWEFPNHAFKSQNRIFDQCENFIAVKKLRVSVIGKFCNLNYEKSIVINLLSNFKA